MFQFYIVRLKGVITPENPLNSPFQFYIVRLKGRLARQIAPYINEFQFYIVRLKAGGSISPARRKKSFNSI